MAYSIMIWLVSPGDHPQDTEEKLRATEGRESAPGAQSGMNIAPAIPRMVYGVYEEAREANEALEELSEHLQKGVPIKINAHDSSRIFVIPTHRVHYVACSEVERSVD